MIKQNGCLTSRRFGFATVLVSAFVLFFTIGISSGQAAPPPSAPASLAVNFVGSDVHVTWSPVPNAAHYNVYSDENPTQLLTNLTPTSQFFKTSTTNTSFIDQGEAPDPDEEGWDDYYYYRVTAVDSLGNQSPGGPVVMGPGADTTTIIITTPTEGSSYLLNSAVNADFTCTGVGFISSCLADVDGNSVDNGGLLPTSTVGTHTFTVNAVSSTGLTMKSVNYNVVYDFKGFTGVKNDPSLNKWVAGLPLPLIFSLAGNQGLNIFEPGSPPTTQQINCSTGALMGTPQPAATTANIPLLYNLLGGKNYTYLLNTAPTSKLKDLRAWKGSCRQFTLTLNDGTTHTANFNFR